MFEADDLIVWIDGFETDSPWLWVAARTFSAKESLLTEALELGVEIEHCTDSG